MQLNPSSIRILVAEDDPDDRFLIEDAFLENKISNSIDFVEDGEELMEYLYRNAQCSDRKGQSLPGLILLDLNMPRMDGRQALKLIKADENLKNIPVVVLTTSRADEDVARAYGLGVNSFISKPVTFEGLVEVTRVLTDYWIQIVRLPTECVGATT